MIEKIRIQNLKSIKDSGDIDIKPLTVIIGKNSSGKSTFLRVFPLLKQSFSLSLSEPILWFHDYVDFGSFRNSINSSCDYSKDTIDLSFCIDKPISRHYGNTNIKNMFVKMSIGEHYIKRHEIITNKNNTFVFNYLPEKKGYQLIVNGEIISDAYFIPPENGRTKFPVIEGFQNIYLYPRISVVPKKIYEKYANKEVKKDLYIYDDPELSIKNTISLEEAKRNAREHIKKLTKTTLPIEEADINVVATNFIHNTVISVLDCAEDTMATSFTNVQYFQPIRARGDRFYRVQGLNTREIDSDGVNGPMFLFYLSKAKRDAFEEWCLNHFGFAYSISEKVDGVESTSVIIKTKDKSEQERNMTDVGFGYSQVFPIILSLWNDITEGKRRHDKIFVIEQPELHLHPAFQKRIIKTLFEIIKLSKENNIKTTFIIETHSETIVNYIGEKVYQTKNDDNINLLVCSKENGESKFQKMVFNDNGTIENWPIGFFSDDE